MKKCARICENPRSNYYSTYSRHRCVRALSLHAFLRPGEIKFTDFRRSRDHGRDHRFRKIHANAQCSSFGGRTRYASRSRFAPYFPRARPRNSPAFSLQFPPRFPLSKLDLSSPLQQSSRVSVSSTILDAFPTLFVHGRGGESEVGIVAPTAEKSHCLGVIGRERERKRESGGERISAEFNVRGGVVIAHPFEGRFEGRCARRGEGLAAKNAK